LTRKPFAITSRARPLSAEHFHFYGQIKIADFPQPALIYAQPVWIHSPAKVVYVQPIYLRVPPATRSTGESPAQSTARAGGQSIRFEQRRLV
jgi:hypothetical protein